MEKEVWGKAAADSAGLMKFYEAHKSQYKWGLQRHGSLFTPPIQERRMKRANSWPQMV